MAVGGAVAAGTWAAPSILSVDAAAAATLLCETISWLPFAADIDDLPVDQAVIPYGTSGTATLTFDDTLVPAPTSSFAGYATVSPLGDETDQITLGMTATSLGTGDQIGLYFDFDVPVQNLSFDLLDVDLGTGNWQDRVGVRALNGASTVPLTLAGNATWNPTYVSGVSLAGIFLEFTGILDPSGVGTGVPNTGAGSTDANVTISIPGPLDRLEIFYLAGPLTPATPQPQQIGIGPMFLCS